MVGGVFLSRPRPYMGCSAWESVSQSVIGDRDVKICVEMDRGRTFSVIVLHVIFTNVATMRIVVLYPVTSTRLEFY